ncbi:hypothetical protein [Streptacidiphilus carbonis]|uniref:hypothetical protein n=1 Tax=Streptacidiphilus carbonis TaxID=105422 RepID=UPI0005A6FB71|nr:hypothetical protein [Streptacidiphilus carbonis]
MPFEDELTDALNDTGNSFRPDLTRLVNSGVEDGRRRNRRRRAVGVLGTVTALAVVGVGGTYAAGALSSDQSTGRSAAPKPSTRVSGTPTTPATVQVSGTGVARPGLSQAQLDAVTKKVMSAFGTVTISRSNTPSGGANGSSGVLDDHQGKAAFDVSLQWADGGDASAGKACPDPTLVPTEGCSVTRLPDGSHVLVSRGWEYSSKKGGMKDWYAILTRSDGRQLMINEYNSAEEKGGVTRTDPPLTAAQLKTAVTAAAWGPAIASLSKPVAARGAGPAASADLAGGALAKVLGGLLPQGLTRSQEHTESGFVDLRLNDGKGAGLFQINVQDWSAALAKNDPSLAALYGGATVLPDGSKLVTRQTGAEKGGSGAVQWTADLLRPDGLRIVAMEFNSPAQGSAADRATPVLTMAQLQAIVSSPAWKK